MEVSHKNIDVWDAWTHIHFTSKFYDMDAFKQHRNSIKILDQQLLGPVNHKKLLHLQCHFGQDNLSLAHLGAKVTGVDYSPQAIETAKALSTELKITAEFICQDILLLKLNKKFDIIYTSYGVLNWLPNLDQWAEVIRKHLNKNGRFVMVEFHPFLNMLNDDFTEIGYNYCNDGKLITYKDQKSYTNSTKDHQKYTTYECLHPLSDILNALTKARITFEIKEYPYSHYNCFPNLIETTPNSGIYQHPFKIPMMFSITGQLAS
ncbi:class I SAM-dependent methyltransferase [Piscirickettsia salmonis]|uniref:class I SAM-dependent methyltransferase n=1 Tax=Piscirickettsia salmonis TaxID=1238 RepID=UPI0007C96D53|nr:bifunctional 3-demethylubiquinone-9 3-methyltransferase/ 2-octaprenyl-6-hydroxy phenol methylase [Piscirickettsiaceae bacterium NZ-RLO1]